MVYCVAIGCNSSTYMRSTKKSNCNPSFHKFPQDPTLSVKWITAMKREGYKPTNYSRICSVHFNPEDFEEVAGNGGKLKLNRLKTSAVPSIFSFSEITMLMKALEKKQKPKQPKQKRKTPQVTKKPPPCLGDGNPCCEREDWENLPIVSNMCNKCVMSCREKCNPEEVSSFGGHKKQKLSTWSSEKIPQEATMRYDQKSGDYICSVCPSYFLGSSPPFRTKKEIDMETHIKSVHLRTRESTNYSDNYKSGEDHLFKSDDYNEIAKRNDGELIDSDPLAACENEEDVKRITSAEATAAIEMLGKFLMQSDVTVDELLLHSQYKGLVLSKISQT